MSTQTLPSLPVNLRENKIFIVLHWAPIIFTAGILPLAGYFALRYGTTLKTIYILTIWLALMGVVSVASLARRSWLLYRQRSTFRPLNSRSRWEFDYFNWNFLVGFIILTVLISVGISSENLRVVSFPLSVLMLMVCSHMVLFPVLLSMRVTAPIVVSSIRRGQQLRPATYVITEDVVAVDGGKGQTFRQAWNDRYEVSSALRAHLARMDLIWGTSGLAVVAIIWALIFSFTNPEIGYAIGWSVPWIWAGIMALVIARMSQNMLRKEQSMVSVSAPQ
ncbi:Hypothetical protein R9X50_00524700 [Acrodontium crateriforme]|uniref:Uncharacterized protein n=1 Tax=Acrodontium crateriforme TaxID=150365 RepID=A0AAQ3R8Z6_9PEZI|nr:Hypothetical protein R9X50_00524700 [Acrodontium crateriforme]